MIVRLLYALAQVLSWVGTVLASPGLWIIEGANRVAMRAATREEHEEAQKAP